MTVEIRWSQSVMRGTAQSSALVEVGDTRTRTLRATGRNEETDRRLLDEIGCCSVVPCLGQRGVEVAVRSFVGSGGMRLSSASLILSGSGGMASKQIFC